MITFMSLQYDDYIHLKKTTVMSEKKQNSFDSPDVKKLQAIQIDEKTTIFVAKDADPEEAKKRYLSRIKAKAVIHY